MKGYIKLLKQGRALIDRPYGWCRGTYSKPDRRVGGDQYCAVGAILVSRAAARASGESREAAVRQLEMTLRSRFAYCYVPEFNDDQGVKKKDVLELYDWAIQDAIEFEKKELLSR